MAVTLGDVIVEGDDRYGEGVNIAARLQQLANPGEVCVSQTVVDHVGNKLGFAFAPHGRPPGQEHRAANPRSEVGSLEPLPRLHRRLYRRTPNPGPRRRSWSCPFTNMSGDAEQGCFPDGITEDIITDLSYFKEFLVIARNTSFTYKGKPMRVGHVCRDLGCSLSAGGQRPQGRQQCPGHRAADRRHDGARISGRRAMTGNSTTYSRCRTRSARRSSPRWRRKPSVQIAPQPGDELRRPECLGTGAARPLACQQADETGQREC